MKKIKMRFSAGKPTVITAEGFAGVGCQQATADYEKILGDKLVSRQPTAEALQAPVAVDQQIGINNNG